jgi:uncharacterized damage-inducible protein DinB
MADVALTFLSDSRAFLTKDYLPSIERCVARLTDEQIWSRPNEASNSIGNLLLHLAGSTRYWATEVIGGTPIGRVRQREFDQREIIPARELMATLRAAVEEADQRLGSLSGPQLLEIRKTREEEFTVLWCVYHIVEHFSYHTGQIQSMTKAFAGPA